MTEDSGESLDFSVLGGGDDEFVVGVVAGPRCGSAANESEAIFGLEGVIEPATEEEYSAVHFVSGDAGVVLFDGGGDGGEEFFVGCFIGVKREDPGSGAFLECELFLFDVTFPIVVDGFSAELGCDINGSIG